MMRKISQMLLGSGLFLVTITAVAGPLQQGKPTTVAQYPQCQDGVTGASKAEGDTGRGRKSVHIFPERADGTSAAIDEYLSFHTQVIDDKGKFSLMPRSGLRTHAN